MITMMKVIMKKPAMTMMTTMAMIMTMDAVAVVANASATGTMMTIAHAEGTAPDQVAHARASDP